MIVNSFMKEIPAIKKPIKNPMSKINSVLFTQQQLEDRIKPTKKNNSVKKISIFYSPFVKIKRLRQHKGISISSKTKSRGYTVKKIPTAIKKTDKSGHSCIESPSKKVTRPKKAHIKYL